MGNLSITFTFQQQILKNDMGDVTEKKHKNLGEILNYASSPLAQIIQKLLNFWNFWNILTPLGSNSDSFVIENILTAADPLSFPDQKLWNQD